MSSLPIDAGISSIPFSEAMISWRSEQFSSSGGRVSRRLPFTFSFFSLEHFPNPWFDGLVDSRNQWQGFLLERLLDGGLGALGKVKEAKSLLEHALRVDPQALQGSAYTSLGALYYQVPGWPIGFGDDEQAEALLKQALALNPDGIDSNYFWGDYLIDQKRYAEARAALLKAQAAAPRPDRPLADQGRQAEIRARLDKIANR